MSPRRHPGHVNVTLSWTGLRSEADGRGIRRAAPTRVVIAGSCRRPPGAPGLRAVKLRHGFCLPQAASPRLGFGWARVRRDPRGAFCASPADPPCARYRRSVVAAGAGGGVTRGGEGAGARAGGSGFILLLRALIIYCSNRDLPYIAPITTDKSPEMIDTRT
jgi:hypothetical protein